jgi:hypothetical protein
MLRLVDFMLRCLYNLTSTQQPFYARLASAHVGLCLLFCFALLELYFVLVEQQGIGGYLPSIPNLVFTEFCLVAICGSACYFTQHPRSYWNVYRGESGICLG